MTLIRGRSLDADSGATVAQRIPSVAQLLEAPDASLDHVVQSVGFHRVSAGMGRLGEGLPADPGKFSGVSSLWFTYGSAPWPGLANSLEWVGTRRHRDPPSAAKDNCTV